MEELLLGRFFARDELDIIHQQDIDRAILGAKLFGGAITNSIDNFVGELLRRNIEHRQAGLHALVPNRVQEVRLAQTNAAV